MPPLQPRPGDQDCAPAVHRPGSDVAPDTVGIAAPEPEPDAGSRECTRVRNRPASGLALVAGFEPGVEETFDTGPPVDAILDAPCEAEIFDDCAYDTMEEEYPCDQEAC